MLPFNGPTPLRDFIGEGKRYFWCPRCGDEKEFELWLGGMADMQWKNIRCVECEMVIDDGG